MSNKKAQPCTEDLEHDLWAWLDDLDNKNSNKGSEIDEAITIIDAYLPKFVLGWTVEELISAIQRR